jgi:hypothetical protein
LALLGRTFGVSEQCIRVLRDRLALWERERNPYPEGMGPFPGFLAGQGFFPGGDGLWRDDAASAQHSSNPVGGIMFVGNDFGTAATFKSTLRRKYETDGVPTWRNLKRRIDAAGLHNTGVCGQLGFYTNAILGLRGAGCAVDRKDWNNPEWWRRGNPFAMFCREFLEFQIEIVKPRLVVVLGEPPQHALCIPNPLVPALEKWKDLRLNDLCQEEHIQQDEWKGRKLTFLLTKHPYSDFGKWKTDVLKAMDAHLLAHAWERANI